MLKREKNTCLHGIDIWGVCESLSPTEAVLPGSNGQIHFHSHSHYHSNNYSHYYYKLDLLKQIKQLPPHRIA